MRLEIKWWMFAIVIMAVFLIVNAVCRPESDSKVAEYEYIEVMENFDYSVATEVSDPPLPDSIMDTIGGNIEEALTGSAVWVPSESIESGEEVPVEFSVIELDDSSVWVKASINGDVLKWERIEHFKEESEIRRWKLQIEMANCSASPYGIGIGYQATKLIGFGVTPSVSVSTELAWIAGQVKISHTIFSGFSGEIGGGYRLNLREDLHGNWHISGGFELSI